MAAKSTVARIAQAPRNAKVTSFARALQVKQALRAATDRDPSYQAIRLRGLAGLLTATEDGTLGDLTNLNEVAFFVSTTLYDIADALSPDETGR